MITKTVKYKGFDGEDIEEVVRLHLTQAELVNLNMKYSQYGGLINYLRKLLTDTQKGDSYMMPLVTMLQTVILAAYGQKLPDGRFVKKVNGVALADEFESSEAYSQLLMGLLTEEGINEIEPLLMGIFPVGDVDPAALAAEKEKLTAALGA